VAEITDWLAKANAVPESLVDWLAVQIAHRVNVFSLRPGGNLEAALCDSLRLPNHNPLRVRILNASQFTPSWLVDQMVQAGATRWTIAPTASSITFGSSYRPEHDESNSPFQLICDTAPLFCDTAPLFCDTAPLFCDTAPRGDFLFHWTRAAELNRQEVADQYLTKLLVAARRPRIRETELFCCSSIQGQLERLVQTLLQILSDMRLRASGRWTRDRRPVVSLTAQPLASWPALRSYRSHLGRWDFEPCGIGLSRDMILKLGGRPVVYGDELAYRGLAAAERTYFQLNCSRSPNRLIDWTIEREWRVPDDIDLRLFGVDDAFVFFKSADTALDVSQKERARARSI
jgi:hypothetical protein